MGCARESTPYTAGTSSQENHSSDSAYESAPACSSHRGGTSAGTPKDIEAINQKGANHAQDASSPDVRDHGGPSTAAGTGSRVKDPPDGSRDREDAAHGRKGRA